uniref:Uncharacterized protein n=1 Tax=Tetradesmus obliquus TaxID=3088 RepID=A0A383VRN5_TETOB
MLAVRLPCCCHLQWISPHPWPTEHCTLQLNEPQPVVHPDWLVACKFGWARQPEAAFALPGYAGTGPGGFNGGSSRLMALGGAAAAAAEREKAAVMKGAGRTDA